MFAETLSKGKKKYAGFVVINGIHRRIDIELCKPEEWGPAICYFTGNAKFNIMMRNYCLSRGMRLNEKSLIDSNGYPIYVRDERNLFEILGLPYVEPTARNL
jgi:DNA polymerase/3'-5' exonuclease PolX